MKLNFLLLLALLVLLPASRVGADIDLGYDDPSSRNTLEIESNNPTDEGYSLFLGDFSSGKPGFTTDAANGLLLSPNDQISISAVDASAFSMYGAGYVNFYNPAATGPQATGLQATGRFAIRDKDSGTTDLVLAGNSIESGSTRQVVGIPNSAGEIDEDLVFDLLDDAIAPTGAYGVLFQLESDFDTVDNSIDLTSDYFWVVWNYGMSESNFKNTALPRFELTAVPEPSSFLFLSMIAVGTIGVRRFRSSTHLAATSDT